MNDTHEHIRQSNLIEGIDSPDEDRRSIRAWNWLIKQERISQPVLLELHRRITLKQLPKHESGKYRMVRVYVGSYIPPAPMIAEAEMYGWLTDLMKFWPHLDPQLMHVRFERIHPFVDGNGRTGRMLMWWHEVKLGQQPTLLKADERQSYYAWFRSAA